VNPFNHALQAGAGARRWNPASVHGAVMLNQEVTRRATIIAYTDGFKLMLVLAIVVTPLPLSTCGSSAR
jgi:MFS transporter, DHA2 family, multidrug resistance protein